MLTPTLYLWLSVIFALSALIAMAVAIRREDKKEFTPGRFKLPIITYLIFALIILFALFAIFGIIGLL